MIGSADEQREASAGTGRHATPSEGDVKVSGPFSSALKSHQLVALVASTIR
jgi:hypothetical protein